MTRMIERWFPCAEVSVNSATGWGSGNAEKVVFPWFAARPTAQAKAAMLCSLLPWPDDQVEQDGLKSLVTEAMTGRYGAWAKVCKAIEDAHPGGAAVLDPFSGRGMIPLEAARLGVPGHGIDYSPVAVLASSLLTDYPYRDWAAEPELPWTSEVAETSDIRLVADVQSMFAEVGRRWGRSVAEFYPAPNGTEPWAYLWAVTLPCQECGHRFPLVGSYELRLPRQRAARKNSAAFSDPGQSFYIDGDRSTGQFQVVVHDGPPQRTPTFVGAVDAAGKKIQGRSAVCVHCGHVHSLEVHKRLAQDGQGRDALLVVADVVDGEGKTYRAPVAEEMTALAGVAAALAAEAPFSPVVAAIPDEEIPANNGATIRPQLYGATTYGDLMGDRQTLSFIRLARVIEQVGDELVGEVGVSRDYARALTGYAAGVVCRKIRRSTRGCTLDIGRDGIHDMFVSESSLAFSYDFLETSPYEGPGTWDSLAKSSLSRIRSLFHLGNPAGHPVTITRGSAVDVPLGDGSMTAVVTDPPYDAMVYYTDLSDLYYVWVKRALGKLNPQLVVTADERGVQEKREEIIVKNHGRAPGDNRDEEHYDTMLTRAFREMRRVVANDGVVSIVFGSGDPQVWNRLLTVITESGLVMTGSWPASTEAGGQQNKANIKTTLTMACRPAPTGRVPGRRGVVESAIRAEIAARSQEWERNGLAPADMLMAAAGPAMEIVGRYSEVLDVRGEPVAIDTFLRVSRTAVQAAMAVEVDHHPLETFDARTRFALWWVRLYGRQIQSKAALRWEVLASSLGLDDVRDLVPERGQGVAFVTARHAAGRVGPESAVIDVALAMVAASDHGTEAMGVVLARSERSHDDAYLWAALTFLAAQLPDSDADAIAASRVLRSRTQVGAAAETAVITSTTVRKKQQIDDDQYRLL